MGCGNVVTLRFRQGYADIVPDEQHLSRGPSRLYLGNNGDSPWLNFDYLRDVLPSRGIVYVALDRSTRGRRTLTGGLVLKREEDGEERTYEFSRNEFTEMRRQLIAR